MKTWVPKGSDLDQPKKWFLVDASGVPLGRLCTRIANILTGKNKPTYTPHADMGDHVIVLNASKVRLTGQKAAKKIYYSHTRYPGGLKQMTAGKKRRVYPDRLVEDAVRGMLPKTKLGRKMYMKLKVYGGDKHPHEAQMPEAVSIKDLR